jgi:hypothetical protein
VVMVRTSFFGGEVKGRTLVVQMSGFRTQCGRCFLYYPTIRYSADGERSGALVVGCGIREGVNEGGFRLRICTDASKLWAQNVNNNQAYQRKALSHFALSQWPHARHAAILAATS